MRRAVPYQPDVTVIANPNPLETLLVGSVFGGVVLALVTTWFAWLLATGAALVVCGGLLLLYSILLIVDGVRATVAVSYLAPLSVPLFLSCFFRHAGSPAVIFAILMPASVFCITWLADQIITVGARLKSRHLNAVTAVVREKTEYYVRNRFGIVSESGLRAWLVERMPALSERMATDVARTERQHLAEFNAIAAAYRRSFFVYGVLTVVSVCLVGLATLLPLPVVFVDAVAVLVSVIPFFIFSLRPIPAAEFRLAWCSYYIWIRRYYTESPPYDLPSVYIPRSGDWTQRMILATACISLCTLSIVVPAHFYPLVAPATLEDLWYQAASVTEPGVELEEFRDQLRSNPARWITCNFALLRYYAFLPVSAFFLSFVFSLGLPIAFVVCVTFGIAGRMVLFLDRRIRFLPVDEE